MREPDAWWGHLPVISKRCSLVGEHWEWHFEQLLSAIRKTNEEYPMALALIPPNGFHVRASRTIEKLQNGKFLDLMAIAICEDTDDSTKDFDLVIVARANNTSRKGSVIDNATPFRSRTNEFIPLLQELVSRIPQGWQHYLERSRGPKEMDLY